MAVFLRQNVAANGCGCMLRHCTFTTQYIQNNVVMGIFATPPKLKATSENPPKPLHFGGSFQFWWGGKDSCHNIHIAAFIYSQRDTAILTATFNMCQSHDGFITTAAPIAMISDQKFLQGYLQALLNDQSKMEWLL